ncbi:ankyrin repeat domain-containing protein [Nocardia flavorosea]|uniref:ankyrin repeat domain-containing protein n=1 Tax=Nocardia flavorosea TaxID=53429 RepID=UPI001892D81F|nr:ankyrin repeat domain-containing protein [Nocardia flavorosea]MBF6351524.1 ankyrin repeat domain-containing protein [Nocardia flavorosea]
MELIWQGAQSRESFYENEVAHRDQLADAARNGEWDRVFALMTEPEYGNSTRVGGTSGFAPLHQAAWHGAPAAVADRLVALGAWRTLRTSAGDTPADIAAASGDKYLQRSLTPRLHRTTASAVLAQLEAQLHALILGRVYELCRKARYRPPQLGPLLEEGNDRMWAPVPGMYGGFAIEFADDADELVVDSWCRVAGGSGQRHRVRRNGFELIESGFV